VSERVEALPRGESVFDRLDQVRFPGLTHRELLAMEPQPTAQLIDGLIETATLGTAAGLPETYKSFFALQGALKIASGGGSVLGRKVLVGGPVGYWWQDDSRENEMRRVQTYARAHGHTGDLPIRWHLNEGLALPNGIGALREEVEREQQLFVVLDSLYNFLPGIKLKDEDVAAVLAKLKAEVCDPTGCAILFVDHSPWPNEGNQGQRRAYGSVFKTAAIRWGVYFDRSGETVFVEAHGNNLTGMPRTPALWDAEALELRLIETPSQALDLGVRISDFLRRNPGAATVSINAGVEGREKEIRRVLQSDEAFKAVPPQLFGPKPGRRWADVARGINDNLGPGLPP
jgi:hypothetical protein